MQGQLVPGLDVLALKLEGPLNGVIVDVVGGGKAKEVRRRLAVGILATGTIARVLGKVALMHEARDRSTGGGHAR